MTKSKTGSDTRKTEKTRERRSAADLLRRVPTEVWIFLFFFLVTVFLTWPLLTRFGSSIYGYPGDNLGGIWANWWVKNAGSFGAKASFCPLIGYPFGSALGSVVPMEPLSFVIDHFLLLFTGEVIAFNIRIFLSFFLSGITMYYLVHYLTRDRRAAVFGGFAYLLIPYHAYLSMYIGGGICEVQWMPLYILFLLKFLKEPSVKRAVWLGAGALIVAGTSVQNGFFMAMFTVVFLIARFAYIRLSARRTRKEGEPAPPLRLNRRTLLLSCAVVLVVIIVIVPFFFLSLPGGKQQVKWPTSPTQMVQRTDFSAYYGSALPQSYFKPGRYNLSFRALGAGPPETLTPDWYSSVYVGWTLIIILAVFVILATRKKKPPGRKKGKVEENGRGIASTVVGLAVVVPVAYLLSLRPYLRVGSARIPLPSIVFRLLVPWFRWYLRVGVVVGICLIVLASIALGLLLKKLKSRSWSVFVLVLVMVVLAFDLLLVPPFRSFSFKKIPPVFESVAKAPKGATFAYYPLFPSGAFFNSQYLFYQMWTKKALLNGAGNDTDGEALRRTVYNPYLDSTPRILSRFGIGYIVCFPYAFGMQGTAGMPKGLELVEAPLDGSFPLGRGYIFKVTAPEANLVPIYMGDISVPSTQEFTPENPSATRVVGRDGIIKILNYAKQGAPSTVTIPIANLRPARRVTITDGDNVLWQKDLAAGEKALARFDLTVPSQGVDVHVKSDGNLARLPDTDIYRFAVEDAALIMQDVRIASPVEPGNATPAEVTPEAAGNLLTDAREALEKDRAVVADLTNKAEQIVAASKGPDKETSDKLAELLGKYSSKWEREKKETAAVINEHADKQLDALAGSAETPLYVNGRQYDMKELSKLPEDIRKSAAAYLTAFRDVYDLYTFTAQYQESGGHLTRIPEKNFVAPFGDVRYQADDNGQLYIDTQPVSYKDLQARFIQAARQRMAEGDQAYRLTE